MWGLIGDAPAPAPGICNPGGAPGPPGAPPPGGPPGPPPGGPPPMPGRGGPPGAWPGCGPRPWVLPHPVMAWRRVIPNFTSASGSMMAAPRSDATFDIASVKVDGVVEPAIRSGRSQILGRRGDAALGVELGTVGPVGRLPLHDDVGLAAGFGLGVACVVAVHLEPLCSEEVRVGERRNSHPHFLSCGTVCVPLHRITSGACGLHGDPFVPSCHPLSYVGRWRETLRPPASGGIQSGPFPRYSTRWCLWMNQG